jgi:hypothetical protein
MTMKQKMLCRMSRDEIEAHLDELTELVSPARHICKKCARVANKKKVLCKPVKLNTPT